MNVFRTTLSLIMMTALMLTTSCGQPEQDTSLESGTPVADTSNFNFVFKYGVTLRNELDTFNGTYTKDMILAPLITINLRLTGEELNQILAKMEEIDFFSYPDVFEVEVPPGGTVTVVTPYNKYYFKVRYGSDTKELRWDDEIRNPDEQANRLRELVNLIRSIIESKEEHKSLPEPKGGYL
jgi:hypothetical protein